MRVRYSITLIYPCRTLARIMYAIQQRQRNCHMSRWQLLKCRRWLTTGEHKPVRHFLIISSLRSCFHQSRNTVPSVLIVPSESKVNELGTVYDEVFISCQWRRSTVYLVTNLSLLRSRYKVRRCVWGMCRRDCWSRVLFPEDIFLTLCIKFIFNTIRVSLPLL
jgi:hypothetical protein